MKIFNKSSSQTKMEKSARDCFDELKKIDNDKYEQWEQSWNSFDKLIDRKVFEPYKNQKGVFFPGGGEFNHNLFGAESSVINEDIYRITGTHESKEKKINSNEKELKELKELKIITREDIVKNYQAIELKRGELEKINPDLLKKYEELVARIKLKEFIEGQQESGKYGKRKSKGLEFQSFKKEFLELCKKDNQQLDIAKNSNRTFIEYIDNKTNLTKTNLTKVYGHAISATMIQNLFRKNLKKDKVNNEYEYQFYEYRGEESKSDIQAVATDVDQKQRGFLDQGNNTKQFIYDYVFNSNGEESTSVVLLHKEIKVQIYGSKYNCEKRKLNCAKLVLIEDFLNDDKNDPCSNLIKTILAEDAKSSKQKLEEIDNFIKNNVSSNLNGSFKNTILQNLRSIIEATDIDKLKIITSQESWRKDDEAFTKKIDEAVKKEYVNQHYLDKLSITFGNTSNEEIRYIKEPVTCIERKIGSDVVKVTFGRKDGEESPPNTAYIGFTKGGSERPLCIKVTVDESGKITINDTKVFLQSIKGDSISYEELDVSNLSKKEKESFEKITIVAIKSPENETEATKFNHKIMQKGTIINDQVKITSQSQDKQRQTQLKKLKIFDNTPGNHSDSGRH